MSKYKHDAILRAWLDGKAIQYLPTGTDVWLDIEPAASATKTPHLYTDGRAEYRIKPVTVRYRVALMSPTKIGQKHYCFTVETVEAETLTATHKGFIRWLTDWTEVEV